MGVVDDFVQGVVIDVGGGEDGVGQGVDQDTGGNAGGLAQNLVTGWGELGQEMDAPFVLVFAKAEVERLFIKRDEAKLGDGGNVQGAVGLGQMLGQGLPVDLFNLSGRQLVEDEDIFVVLGINCLKAGYGGGSGASLSSPVPYFGGGQLVKNGR